MKYHVQKLKSFGFTLIEMVITITILGLASVLGAKILFQATQAYNDNQSSLAADWQFRLALERMQRDMRNIVSPINITTMGANTFSYTCLLYTSPSPRD